MTDRGSLENPTTIFVADASVAINLIATGMAEKILDALPNRIVITKTVLDEIEEGGRNGKEVSSLVVDKHISVVQLGDADNNHFGSLVSGTASQTLDDGEAATIAYALEHSATAIIDEKKALRICRDKYRRLSTGCSVDLFMNNHIQKVLGKKIIADAIYMALINAHMRVLPQHIDWVIESIGHSRAAQCNSLPWSARKGLNPIPL